MKECSTCSHGNEQACTWRNRMVSPPACRVMAVINLPENGVWFEGTAIVWPVPEGA